MSRVSFVDDPSPPKFIDDATGAEVKWVIWVDAVLEYGKVTHPWQYFDAGWADVVKVSSVSVNFAAREVHFNTPRPVLAVATPAAPLNPCDECRQQATCRRIDYCPQYRCGFGEAKQP